jgi:hypothetical protein
MKSTSDILAMVLSLVILLSAGIGLRFFNLGEAKMGDWGDYLGGVAGVGALIWLIIGHLDNQREIIKTQSDLKTQLELTREAVGALTRISSGAHVQAAVALTEAEPQFQYVNSAGTPVGDSVIPIAQLNGYVQLENVGGPVILEKASAITDQISVSLENNGLCAKGSRLKLILQSKNPLKSAGAIHIRLLFKDKFQRSGFADIKVDAFGNAPDIQVHIGSPKDIEYGNTNG